MIYCVIYFVQQKQQGGCTMWPIVYTNGKMVDVLYNLLCTTKATWWMYCVTFFIHQTWWTYCVPYFVHQKKHCRSTMCTSLYRNSNMSGLLYMPTLYNKTNMVEVLCDLPCTTEVTWWMYCMTYFVQQKLHGGCTVWPTLYN